MMGQGSKSKVKVESKVNVNGQGQGGRQQGKIEYLRFLKNSTSGPVFFSDKCHFIQLALTSNMQKSELKKIDK